MKSCMEILPHSGNSIPVTNPMKMPYSGSYSVKKTLEAFRKFSDEQSKLYANIVESMAPSLKIQESMTSSLKPFLDFQRRIQINLKPLIPQVELGEAFKAMQDVIKAHSSGLNQTMERMRQTFARLPDNMQRALSILSDQGWYLDSKMPFDALWEIETACLNGEIKSVESVLIEYYEENLDRIESEITAKFPARKEVIEAAFRAHRNAEYYLSIPPLLAQADGICGEQIGKAIFMKRNGRPQTAEYVDTLISDTYKAVLLSPLSEVKPINTSQRGENFDGLNRHMVLHGESIDYGTQTNSCKAISLISYLVSVSYTHLTLPTICSV